MLGKRIVDRNMLNPGKIQPMQGQPTKTESKRGGNAE
jgi:hypothetical protein